jgi:hypothetical protein
MQFWKSITSLQEKEFLKMFQVPVIEVPTNLPNIRKDLPIQAFAVVVFFFLISQIHFLLIYNNFIRIETYLFIYFNTN